MAQRFQLKRSSIAGKRPGSEYLEPGELALNTNSHDAGVYFEANDGTVLKAGPTFVGESQPTSEIGYGHGETWLDTANGSLKVWNEDETRWMSAVSPAQGGVGTVVYVGSEYPEASDAINNDGSARPFATINRACLEVARRSILQNQSDELFNKKFTIVLLPGDNVVYNEPGLAATKFFDSSTVLKKDSTITPTELSKFNPVTGGLPLPRGTSIIGLDMRKTRVLPSFYPYWTPAEGSSEEHPRTNIISWTGNSFISNLTFTDKTGESVVTQIDGEADDNAILHCATPQSFKSFQTKEDGTFDADVVSLSYSANVKASYLGESSIPDTTELLIEPLSPGSFQLRHLNGDIVKRRELPFEPAPGTEPPLFLSVKSSLATHHRLSAVSYATTEELDSFYDKIGHAFSEVNFGVSENTYNVVDTETNVIAKVGNTSGININTGTEAEAYAFNVTVRSNYGLCGLLNDGQKVAGVKTAKVSHFTSVSLQNDFNVFEVYYNKKWRSLKEAYATSTGVSQGKVKGEDAILWLGEKVELENIRYFYRTERVNGQDSNGLPEDFSDARHYMLKATHGAVIDAQNVTAVGISVGCWAQSGGEVRLTNSSSTYGGQALRAEGFLGIGTGGGALPPDRDFVVKGIRRPAAIPYVEILNENNHRKFALNADISFVSSTHMTFTGTIDILALRPFTLKPGTVIWVEQVTTGLFLKATIGSEGLNAERNMLHLESENNEIDGADLSTLSTPFVRRFIDPRPPTHQSYSLWVENSSQFHRPPSPSSVLRLAEKPGQGKTDVLVYGRQLDPGENGGWNHVFSVAGTLSKKDGDSPNYYETSNIATANDGNYYVQLRLANSYGPWLQFSDEVEAKYPRGSFCSFEDRAFYADSNELVTGDFSLVPNGAQSNWRSSKVTEYLEEVGETYFPPSYPGARDPNNLFFSSDFTNYYARGLTCARENYEVLKTVDWDNGEADFGLGDADKQYMDPKYSDPNFATSKQAILRLLSLLGYDLDELQNELTPKTWSQRNLSVADIPVAPQDGYAASKGEWPIEFNKSSSINATSHSWENAGYIDYLNGLPSFQTSVLNRRQRFDAISTEVWGGTVFVSGSNESGKFVMNSVNVVDASGRSILHDDDLGAPVDMTTVHTYGNQTINGTKSFSEDVLPADECGASLGTPTQRWANVYTCDLHLQNERGDWTMVEEKDYLTLRNNKTGKTFRLMMEEL